VACELYIKGIVPGSEELLVALMLGKVPSWTQVSLLITQFRSCDSNLTKYVSQLVNSPNYDPNLHRHGSGILVGFKAQSLDPDISVRGEPLIQVVDLSGVTKVRLSTSFSVAAIEE